MKFKELKKMDKNGLEIKIVDLSKDLMKLNGNFILIIIN